MKDMMNKLIRRLEKNSDVSAWLIAQEQALSAQGFYVLQKLETRRVADTTEYKVTVYRDFQEDGTSYTGSASFLVSHDLTAAQIDRQIREALYAASFVKNPAYTLVEGGPKKTFRGRSFGEDPFQIIDQVAEAFFAGALPLVGVLAGAFVAGDLDFGFAAGFVAFVVWVLVFFPPRLNDPLPDPLYLLRSGW